MSHYFQECQTSTQLQIPASLHKIRKAAWSLEHEADQYSLRQVVTDGIMLKW